MSFIILFGFCDTMDENVYIGVCVYRGRTQFQGKPNLFLRKTFVEAC